jgi:carbon monoxide dehydrogenase subunit G
MRKLFNVPAFLLALLPGIGWGVAIETADLPEPTVRINNQDGTLIVNISYRVPVPPREAWAVLTDFEGMPGFIPNLEISKVLLRTGKTIQVEQKGSISLGVLPIHYESTRQIEVVPYQTIRSHTLSGDTRMESIMVLTPSGSGTLLSYRATAVPDLPVPSSLVSSYMNDMLENQFKAMGQEMVRRAQQDNADGSAQAAQTTGQQIATQAGKPTAKQPVTQAKLAPKKPRTQTKKRPG